MGELPNRATQSARRRAGRGGRIFDCTRTTPGVGSGCVDRAGSANGAREGIMDLFGPFLVNGRAISTGLTPNAGDRISVLTSGMLTALRAGAPAPDAVTADGLVNGGPQAAPAGWPDPGLTQLSLVGHVGGQRIQLGTGVKVVPANGGARPVGSELSVDVNAPPSTQFDDGWSVYLVRATSGEQLPGLRDWSFFEDLTSTMTD